MEPNDRLTLWLARVLELQMTGTLLAFVLEKVGVFSAFSPIGNPERPF